jgi:hypothetical protein
VLRSGIARLKEKGRNQDPAWCLAGLNVPSGLDPFVEVYQRALLKGSEDLREAGASALGELIDVSDTAVLIKKIVVITGPLIRVFGDKFGWQVKAAILSTFGMLIAKAGLKIKQFVPQLQGIFTKALRASSRPVRSKAVAALEQLLPLFPANKVDPLIKDLNKGIKEGGVDSDDPLGVVESLLHATRSVLMCVGHQVSADTISLLTPTVMDNIFHDEDACRVAAAQAAAHCLLCSGGATEALLLEHVLEPSVIQSGVWSERHGAMLCLAEVLANAPAELLGAIRPTAVSLIAKGTVEDNLPVRVCMRMRMCMCMCVRRCVNLSSTSLQCFSD